MDLRDLRTLAAISRSGSFEAAARALNITASAVSQRVSRLEDEIGLMVVMRGTPATMTKEGEVLLRAGRQIDALLEDVRAEIKDAEPGDPIPVAVNHDTLATWFVDAVVAFQHGTGRLLEVVLADHSLTTRSLRSGAVAVAVSSDPSPVAGCEASVLGIMRYTAVVHAGLLPRLADIPAIFVDRADTLSAAALAMNPELFGSTRITYLPGVHEARRAVLAKAGWSIMPYALVKDDLDRGDLAIAMPRQFIDIPMYLHSWRSASPTIHELCQTLRRKSRRVLL